MRTRVKLTSLLNNFMALPAFGGITIVPCNPLAMLSPGRNFGLPSGHTIFLKDLMERKLNEFLALTQGTRIVLQYAQTFNHLCQYAGYHADNDAKKQERFHHGLNTNLKERLNLVKANTFSELVNMALTQEDCITVHYAEKKRKTPTGPSSVQPPRYRVVPNA
jgi:hypothetical protein